MAPLDLARYAIGIGLIAYALSDVSGSYSGPMTVLHSESRSMATADREGLAESLEAASKMLADDKAGLVQTTEDLQRFVRGTMAYGYTAFATSKYPKVASALQGELERTVGTKTQAVTPEIRSSTVSLLEEAGRAIR